MNPKMNPRVATVLALVLSFVLILAVSCGKKTDENDIEEIGQQVGDVMASVDETGGSSGTIAFNLEGERGGSRRLFARLGQDSPVASKVEQILDQALIPSAHAVSCWGYGFSTCVGTTKTRDFGGCTLLWGTLTFNGTVTLTWGGTGVTTCLINGNGTYISRSPNFTVTGRRGATLSVTKTGSFGQRVTKTASGFDFTNDGIRRVFTTSDGSTLFDFTTTTLSAISVTGTSRSDRVLSGGSLRVTNNSSGTTCDFSPSNVAWSSSCNCAVSGSWSGSCSDGQSSTLTLTGCGSGTLVVGETSKSITFDRCTGA